MTPAFARVAARITPVLVVALIVSMTVNAFTHYLGSAEEAPSTYSFTPTADASVSASHPSRNYGRASRLEVDGSPHKLAYIQFELPNLSGTVAVAKLRLFVVDPSSEGGSISVAHDLAWQESSITYENQPTSSRLTIANLGRVVAGQWYEVDVTPATAGAGAFTLVIESQSENGADYASRESTNPPLLIIEMERSNTVQLPIPEPTATDTPTETPFVEDPVVPTETGVPSLPIETPTQEPTPNPTEAPAEQTPDEPIEIPNQPIAPPTNDAEAQVFTFVADADASVSASRPNKNFGQSVKLEVDGNSEKLTYMRFDVQGLSGDILDARLRLFVVDKSPTGGRVALVASDAWSENTVTYLNRPLDHGAVIDSLGPVEVGFWYEFNVSSAVTTNGLLSFVVTSDHVNGVDYASRETSTPPQLVVTVAPGDPLPVNPDTDPDDTPPDEGHPPPTGTPPQDGTAEDLSFPIRAAFYYPWFPNAWRQSGVEPYTHYTPTSGYYRSDDAQIVQQHIAAMQYGNVQAGIASWWGQGHHTDTRIPLLLDIGASSSFKWALYYEPEGLGNPAVSQLKTDLDYIAAHYASHAGYLHVQGKPVLFVWDSGERDDCALADRWAEANDGRFHIVLKVFSGYRNCETQPDSWHQYGPAKAADRQQGQSYTISPGFWHRMESEPRLERDLDRWRQDIRNMVESGDPWQLITSFNEWGEGTSVESATEWSTSSGFGAYLDALHDNGVAPAADPGPSPTPEQEPTQGKVTIMAAGDIACDPESSSFNGGNGTSTSCRQKYTADLIVNHNPDAVIVPGDLQYTKGELWKFLESYDKSWGQFKDKTFPVPGNHEYETSGAAGYFDYFGERAGERGKGYYTFEMGAWQFLALNTNCSKVGGCGPGSPQYEWLRKTLEAGTGSCEIAFMHEPRWSSSKYGMNDTVRPLYDLLYEYGVEIALAGHAHNYERFAPQDPNGTRDDERGIRQFVVGTGGKNLYSFEAILPNSEVRDSKTFGVLKLVLDDGSYQWQFVPEAGKTFSDTGTGSCR